MREKKSTATSRVQAVEEDEQDELAAEVPLDLAVAEPLTMKSFFSMISKTYTWLPALMYSSTFGFELAVDANLANILVADHPKLGQLNAGYYTSMFGFLNVVTRPFGGWLGDKIYTSKRFGGVRAKKYLTIVLGVLQGLMSLSYGLVCSAFLRLTLKLD
jgi:NNP family nitrate/nitrite transporter-like MFS transporter